MTKFFTVALCSWLLRQRCKNFNSTTDDVTKMLTISVCRQYMRCNSFMKNKFENFPSISRIGLKRFNTKWHYNDNLLDYGSRLQAGLAYTQSWHVMAYDNCSLTAWKLSTKIPNRFPGDHQKLIQLLSFTDFAGCEKWEKILQLSTRLIVPWHFQI